jgi:hypothetical protein
MAALAAPVPAPEQALGDGARVALYSSNKINVSVVFLFGLAARPFLGGSKFCSERCLGLPSFDKCIFQIQIIKVPI